MSDEDRTQNATDVVRWKTSHLVNYKMLWNNELSPMAAGVCIHPYVRIVLSLPCADRLGVGYRSGIEAILCLTTLMTCYTAKHIRNYGIQLWSESQRYCSSQLPKYPGKIGTQRKSYDIAFSLSYKHRGSL